MKHGYKKASTDNIVREAGIGKGMLFYYFNSKRGLYDFLIEYTFACLEDYFSRLTLSESGDLIEHYRLASKLKLEAYVRHPLVMNFIGAVYLNTDEAAFSPEAEEKLQKFNEYRANALESVFDRIDTTLFREDLPAEKVIRYVQWSMDGYIQYVMANINKANLWEASLEPLFNEFDEYLNDMKKIFYK